MRVLIAGDLVVNHSYDASRKIDQNIIDLFTDSDCNIVNLEAPVTNSNKKILKTGPHLKSNKQSTLDVIKNLNINIVTLANNHIRDYDNEGVLDTIAFCEDNKIKPIGAGKNLLEASRTTILHTEEGKIAIINIAENEWSSADQDSAGANGMNIIKDTKKIQQAKKENDFVFVIIHGGHEYYNLPSPRMQEQYRFYAEQGADLIVGHHTHCISGYEIYEGTPIYYSLGNFLFTMSNIEEDWYTGLILEINISDSVLITKLHPVSQEKESFKLKLLEDKKKNTVLLRIENYKKVIESESELSIKWKEFIFSRRESYLNYWSPKIFIKNRYVAFALNRLKIPLTNARGISYYLNLLRCEAHHDLSKAILEKSLKK